MMTHLASKRIREFFESLSVKTSLSQYGVTADKIPAVLISVQVVTFNQ